MNERSFENQPETSSPLQERLKPMMRELERYHAKEDDVMEAQTLALMSNEIVEAWQFNPRVITLEELKLGLGYELKAAKLFDVADRLLEGWEQRARFLNFIESSAPDEIRKSFDIDQVKQAMGEFGDKIHTYSGSISHTPRYIQQEARVLSENERLHVHDRGGNGKVTDESDQTGW